MTADFDSARSVDGQERDIGVRQRATREGEPLRSVVVEYPNGPDQRTVFPRDVTGFERTTTWLTARADAFVDLGDAR